MSGWLFSTVITLARSEDRLVSRKPRAKRSPSPPSASAVLQDR